jgi:hypothetical protein
MAFAGTIDGISAYCGPWLGVKNRYLGLKFQIRGTSHFGWARLSVVSTENSITSAALTGYAYETVANKPIIAGKTKGRDVVTLPRTLGHLAAGSSASTTRRTGGNR